MPNLKSRLHRVIEKIEIAEKKSGRKNGSVVLMAASKNQSAEVIAEALSLGISNFGENYVQEAKKKMEKISTLTNKKATWHLIGALQTNKSKSTVGHFETIQSVDRVELAKALSQRAVEVGTTQRILIQVKLGDEPTKGGVSISDGPAVLEKISGFSNLRIDGLMALPPLEAEPEQSRKYFRQLFDLEQKWKKYVSPSQGSFSDLSMGMTHDYEIAIEEGATIVRIGTALFGPRIPAASP